MPYGMLGQIPQAADILGVALDHAGAPTRYAEYSKMVEAFEGREPGYVLDAATGYVQRWHIAPYLLALLGWEVFTIDIDQRTMDMEPAEGVERTIGNMVDVPKPDATFDAIVCISTLEHIHPDEQARFAAEAARLAKPGALLFVTMDASNPTRLPELFSEHFDIGELQPEPTERTQPNVAYAVGERR